MPVLDSGARGSTTTFVERGIGDVLIAWENEALLAISSSGPDKFEIVVPSVSILAEPPVAVIDKVATKHGTTQVARGVPRVPLHGRRRRRSRAKHYFRPTRSAVAGEVRRRSSRRCTLFTVDELFGGWAKAQQTHFADGGVFDQIYRLAKK